MSRMDEILNKYGLNKTESKKDDNENTAKYSGKEYTAYLTQKYGIDTSKRDTNVISTDPHYINRLNRRLSDYLSDDSWESERQRKTAQRVYDTAESSLKNMQKEYGESSVQDYSNYLKQAKQFMNQKNDYMNQFENEEQYNYYQNMSAAREDSQRRGETGEEWYNRANEKYTGLMNQKKTGTPYVDKYGAGNIDLTARPQVMNSDGKISTVDSVTFGIDDKQVVIPTVIYEDGQWKHVDSNAALEHYKKTGEYLGIFDTREEADAYAEQLHLDQEKLYSDSEYQATSKEDIYKQMLEAQQNEDWDTYTALSAQYALMGDNYTDAEHDYATYDGEQLNSDISAALQDLQYAKAYRWQDYTDLATANPEVWQKGLLQSQGEYDTAFEQDNMYKAYQGTHSLPYQDVWDQETLDKYDELSKSDPAAASEYAAKIDKLQWTDDQMRTFGYLYETDRDKAYEYANEINTGIDQQKKYAATQDVTESVNVGEWATAQAGRLGTLGEFLNNAIEYASTGTVTSKPYMSVSEYADAIDGKISETLNNLGTTPESWGVLGNRGAGDAYQIAMSILQSTATGAAGKGATFATFFGSAAASAFNQAVDQGATAGQALLYGTASGIFEGLFEELSLDKVKSLSKAAADSGTALKWLKAMGVSGLIEGSEEINTSIADMIAEAAILQENSSTNQRIEEIMLQEGKTYDEAYAQAFKENCEEVAWSGISGAVSGIAHSVGYSIAGTRQYKGSDKQAIINAAKNSGNENLAKEFTDKENISVNQANRIVNTVGEENYIRAVRELQQERMVEYANEKTQAQTKESYKNKVSEEAKTTGDTKANTADVNITYDNKAATVKGLVGTQEGNKVQLQYEDGTTENVSVNDVYDSLPADYKALLDWSEPLGKAAPGVVSRYDGSQSVSEYMTAMDEAINLYAANGISLSKAGSGSLVNTLNETQKAFAEEFGKGISSQKQSKVNAKTAAGTVTFGGDTLLPGMNQVTAETAKQVWGDSYEENYSLAQAAGKAFKQNIVFFDSMQEDGTLGKTQGLYTPSGTIYIDIRAGMSSANTGKSIISTTLSHELTHFAEHGGGISYDKLKSFMIKHLSEWNDGQSFEQLVESKRKRSSKNMSYDQAVSEVIADGCEQMLTRSEYFQQMAEEDIDTAKGIKGWLDKALKKLRDAIKGGHREAEYFASSEKLLNELSKLWDNAIKAAVENTSGMNKLSQETREELKENGMTVYDGVVVTEANARLMEEEGFEKPLDYSDAEEVQEAVRTTPDWMKSYLANGGDPEVAKTIEKYTEDMMMNDTIMGYVPTGDYKYTKTGMGALRKNVEYIWTFDMDASCPRTFQFLAYRNRLQSIAGRPLTFNESINLMYLMKRMGQQIPCTYCYVENKRILKNASYLNYFMFRDGVMSAATKEEALTKMYSYNAKKGTVSEAAQKVLDEWWEDKEKGRAFHPSATECWTEWNTARNSIFNYLDGQLVGGAIKIGVKRGATSMKALNTNVNKRFKVTDDYAKREVEGFVQEWAYNKNAGLNHMYAITNDVSTSRVDQRYLRVNRLAMNYASSVSQARNVDNYVPYTDQLKNVKKADKDYIIGMGGLRKHSSNDFRLDYLHDYLLLFADMAAGKWTGHTYTKNTDYCKIFGRTGDRINLSIAMTTRNGKIVMNDQEGANWKEARELRKAYGENLGVMAMVTDNAQLSFALNSDWIDMCIPFHASGLAKEVWYNVNAWFDYTNNQLESFYTSTEMKQKLKEAGVSYDKLNSAQVEELFDKTFNIKSIINANGNKVRPHFFPNDTVVNGQTVPGHHNDANLYKQLCEQYGVHPRFYGIKVTNKAGEVVDITDHENYIKVIKETSRTETEQKPIQFNLNEYDPNLGMSPMEYGMERMLQEAKNGGYENTKDDTWRIVEKFQKYYLGKDREIGWMPELTESDPDANQIDLAIELHENAQKEMYDADVKVLDQEGYQKVLLGDQETQASYRGETADGIEVYETSDEVKNLGWNERRKRYRDIMRKQYRGRTAKFIRNGHAYYATFQKVDINKQTNGDDKSSPGGRDAKTNVGADGNIFELVENSNYTGSRAEIGKNKPAHIGVKYWDYYEKTVQIDGTVFDVLVDVRKKTNDQYVYDISLNENNEIKAAPPHDPSLKGSYTGAQTASVDNVPQISLEDKKNINTSAELESAMQASEREKDPEVLAFLDEQEEKGEVVHTFKSFQLIDGKLYPPMAAKTKGEDGKYRMANAMAEGEWEKSVGNPKNIKIDPKNGKGYFVLNKGNGKSITAAYNPYQHSSNMVLNDQFEEAYKRPNLVTYECIIPKSELTSGYQAEYAKDAVGMHEWKAGVVAGKMKDNKRMVYLSRWLKPVRQLSNAEVAEKYKELLEKDGISVPFNVVTPDLLSELEKIGVPIDYNGSPMYQAAKKRAAESAENQASERDTERVETVAIDHFGTTENFNEAGYILKSGKMLDFSGRHWGLNESQAKGRRDVDHEDIYEAFDEAGVNSTGDNRLKFIESGNIRFSPEAPGINLSAKVEPTSEQYDRIREFLRQSDAGSFYVDFEGKKADRLQYSGSVNADRVIADMKHYYKTGEARQQSIISQFYSERDDSKYTDTNSEQTGRTEAYTRLQSENKLLQDTIKELNKTIKQQNKAAEETAKKTGTKISELKRQLQLTKTPEARVNDARKIANRILKEYSSTADRVEVTKTVKELGDYIIQHTGDEMDYDRLQSMASAIADKVIDNVSVELEDGGASDYYKEITNEIKGSKMSIAKQDRGELNVVGGYNAFRNANRKNFTLGDGYSGVDSVYQGLQNRYGTNAFPEVNNPGEMLLVMSDLFDRAQKPVGNPYEDYYDEAVNTLSNDILFEAIGDSLRQTSPTFADREKAKQQALKAKGAAKLQEVKGNLREVKKDLKATERKVERRDDTIEALKEKNRQNLENAAQKAQERYDNLRDAKNKRIEEVRKEGVTKKEEAVAAEKAEKWKKVKSLREYYKKKEKEANERRQESAGKSKYRKQILEEVKKLSNMLLKNSDKEHVPEALKEPLIGLIESIDPSSSRKLSGGEETKADQRFADRMQQLHSIFSNQQKIIDGVEGATGQPFDMYLDMSQESIDFLNQLNDVIANVRANGLTFTLNSMDADGLKSLSLFLRNLTAAIKQANTLIANSRFATVREAAAQDIEHMQKLGKVKGSEGSKILSFLKWEDATPYFAFQRFGEGAKSIFEGFTKGWEKLAFNANQIINFTKGTYKPEEVRAWKKQLHDITLEDGSKIQMTTAQIMEFSQLLGREHALGHINAGGVRIGNINRGINASHPLGETLIDTKHYHFTQNDILNITSKLTQRQLEVAQKLQKYMAVQGSLWGNEVSMKRFGYEFYTEGDKYYPIVTDSTDRPMNDTDAQENSMFRLLNLSSSKSLTPHANNALVVNDIFDTFSDHMADQAKLNAMGLPVLDAIKWFNYKEKTKYDDGTIDTKTTQAAMEQAFGNVSLKYFRTLVKDINGVKESGDRGTDILSKMMSNYKVAAVAANLRVALLQPTSYVRASFMIEPKYLIQAFKEKNGYQEALKYSGTALWKSLGYYDTNISRSLRQQIENDSTWKDELVEKSMIGAEKGDALTWGRMWVACKLKAQAENPKLTGEELNQKTADLFREVIYSSQVMDSTLTRSELMRGNTKATKALTAFMAEPTLSYNLLLDAYSKFELSAREHGKKQAWQNNKSKIAKAFMVYTSSAAFSAIVESFADAFRNSDDEDFWDKFLEAMFGEKGVDGNLVQDLLIVGKVPYFKDLLSVIQGYGNGDMSTEAFDTAYKAYKIWKETIQLELGTLEKATDITYYGKMTTYGKIYKTLQALSQISGIPASAAIRDAVALWNNTFGALYPDMKVRTYDKNKLSGSKLSTYKASIKPTGLTQKQYSNVLTEADADGNGSLKQDELGAYLKQAVKTGLLTDTQADAVWNANGWKSSRAEWEKNQQKKK